MPKTRDSARSCPKGLSGFVLYVATSFAPRGCVSFSCHSLPRTVCGTGLQRCRRHHLWTVLCPEITIKASRRRSCGERPLAVKVRWQLLASSTCRIELKYISSRSIPCTDHARRRDRLITPCAPKVTSRHPQHCPFGSPARSLRHTATYSEKDFLLLVLCLLESRL